MKLTLVGITVLLYAFISTLSHAASERPLLGKYNYPGYVMEEHNNVEQCEVMASGVIIKSVIHYGQNAGILSSETFPLNIPVDEIKILIELATHEPMTTSENYLCDGPSTSVIAYGSMELAEHGMMSIYNTGGCGMDKKAKKGMASAKMMQILDRHCPETHDFSRVEN